MDAFWAAPPVSRTLTALTLGTSLLVYGGLLSPTWVVFHLPRIFKFPMPEIWRFFSAFWLTGPKLDILFDTYFMWTYSKGLETGSTRFSRPGDYFIYVMFVGLVILLLCAGILGGWIFTSPLILAFTYTYSQDNKGKKVSFFVVTFNIIWLPWAMLLLTFIMGGPHATLYQATGILAAHMYDFITRIYPTFGGGRNYIHTPAIVRRWFGSDKRGANVKAYGTSYRSVNNTSQPASRVNGVQEVKVDAWEGIDSDTMRM
ncbi:MAG: hypothetical protein HETSPECPRED_000362 [Heterodermia speciosa]|uniref:Derlin n=1 Tax=Heterodermia speciosa TaxID=116794 RepID=A0A8H3ERT5_9LECA|nr:MAG: hypothetical protein HETSPECPRED_000362 [Heterodermia speciosa]